MLRKILARNKAKYIEYNNLRKDLFAENSPKESEVILYILPWLLSVNHPNCPGYLSDLDVPFRVFNIQMEKGIKHREQTFKDRFGIQEKGSLVKPVPNDSVILGLYTIGSIGTISQTQDSDCDIWVCYDSREMDIERLKNLNRKLYLIKEWISLNCKLPVYFFVSDIGDIRDCRFGSVDEESSGSTQTHVLKEEFYRTCVLICGKIPLWWVCYDSKVLLSYDRVLAEISKNPLADNDFLDMGNLESVEEDEYFGAALWQLNKSLDRPLKSIIKMLMLKMQLDASSEELVCHKFRQHIMIKNPDNMIPDPSVFSMFFIMNYYGGKSDPDTITFIKECYYLRCGIKPHSKKDHLKKRLTSLFFSQFDIAKDVRENLDRFSNWDLEAQIIFGKGIYKLLLQIYRDISMSHSGVSSRINKEDLTVIGRKIQVVYESKEYKIAVLPKSTDSLNISSLAMHIQSGKWQVSSGNITSGHLVSDIDILYITTFIVKNEMFQAGRIHMVPNKSSVSLPEIENLAIKIRDFIHQNHSIVRSDYLKKARITKLLVVISFEEEPWEKVPSNIGLIYKNSWGEVFVRRFNTERRLKDFLDQNDCREGQVLVDYYLQRKCINYTVLLNQVKKMIEG